MATLLLSVDSLRADHLGQYGYDRDTMPALDSLVDDGAVFENAFANAPYTRISIPAIHASRHLVYDDLESFPTVAGVLSNGGVPTAVIGTQTAIDIADFGFGETIDLDEASGRDDETYHREKLRERSAGERVRYRVNTVATRVSQFLQRHELDGVYGAVKRPYNAVVGGSDFRHQGYTGAADVTDRAISWLESNDEPDFFLWLHYMDPHRPYGLHDDEPAYLDGPLSENRVRDLMRTAGTDPEAISERERRLMRDLYDSDVRYCSRHLARLFERLRDLGRWEELNVIFTADHGEEFAEHGRYFHRNYPYDELIHVPLVVKAPDHYDGGETIAEGRELLDVAPTIRALHGVGNEDDDDGTPRSESAFEGGPVFEGESRRVIALGQPPDAEPAVAVREEEWKYIREGESRRLYDIAGDPEEREDVLDENRDVAKRLDGSIPEHLLTREAKPPRAPDDEVDRERLDALGYLELQEDE